MQRAQVLIVSLLMVFCLAACGSDPAEKLNGTWLIDMDATIESNEHMKSSIPQGDIGKAARDLLLRTLGSMTLTFDAKNNTMSGVLMGSTIPSTKFEVLGSSGDEIQLNLEGETISLSVNDDELRIKDDPIIVFKRQ